VISVGTAYPCACQNRQILSSRISETLSLNQYVPFAWNGFTKLGNVFSIHNTSGVLHLQISPKQFFHARAMAMDSKICYP
jgi:hypothetical protein